jgi:hypothetical protein
MDLISQTNLQKTMLLMKKNLTKLSETDQSLFTPQIKRAKTHLLKLAKTMTTTTSTIKRASPASSNLLSAEESSVDFKAQNNFVIQ